MRAISVFERETIAVVRAGDARLNAPPEPGARACIDEFSAAALERLNATRPKFCRWVVGGIQLFQMCGIVRLPNGLVLEILPKVWSADSSLSADRSGEEKRARLALLRMLSKNQDLKFSVLSNASQDLAKLSLIDVFVRAFVMEVLWVAHGGLKSSYIETVSDSPVLRGRMLFVETQIGGASRNGLVRCVHDDFSSDNPYNQILLAALLACRQFVLSAATQRFWFEARSMLSAISIRPMNAQSIKKLARNRSTKRYDEALVWAKIILELQSPTLSHGENQAPSLLFDMEKLFERWVEAHANTTLKPQWIARRHGTVRHLATIPTRLPADESDAEKFVKVFKLTPDVLVWRADEAKPGQADSDPEAIIDAKWKAIDPAVKDWGVREGDIYQMLAYATRFRCLQATLAYPIFKGHQAVLAQPPVFHIDIGSGQVVKVLVGLIPIDD
ncbi:McrBC 5-methylcytosine restriction system component [Collimonas sp. OK307]|uniref:McrC family protein n=1 Tax=Collimonas sp. OK307 TaxID=1801620 RepID=UPI0008E4E268|nr:hypothetical protein [Collimonas sp. OK307]SFI48819.1 McrBC 5-methylcytosine restriction system component [Collimonas sp. OK307]